MSIWQGTQTVWQGTHQENWPVGVDCKEVTAKDGDKVAAQGTRGLIAGEETPSSTRLADRPGESTTRVEQDAGQGRAGTNTRQDTREDLRQDNKRETETRAN